MLQSCIWTLIYLLRSESCRAFLIYMLSAQLLILPLFVMFSIPSGQIYICATLCSANDPNIALRVPDSRVDRVRSFINLVSFVVCLWSPLYVSLFWLRLASALYVGFRIVMQNGCLLEVMLNAVAVNCCLNRNLLQALLIQNSLRSFLLKCWQRYSVNFSVGLLLGRM